MDWIHFIGKSFYTINSFEKEAAEKGVSRRIDKRILKKMNYGDRVHLFQKQGKSSICFGHFTIDSVWGKFPDAMMKELDDEGKITDHHCGLPMVISRGCGSFMMVSSSSINCTLQEIADKIEKHGAENVMVGGTYSSKDQIRSNIPFQHGFRKFDYVAFIKEYNTIMHKAKPMVQGSFYVDKKEPINRMKYDGIKFINTIESYQKKGTAS